ncbi:MAG: hypothetical protein KAR38_11755 [Calditrichia bacterium]|nr:hypothetical protein [Calditrichia bacterium]
MKRLVLVFIMLLMAAVWGNAQDIKCLRTADSLFSIHQYENSIEYYEQANQKQIGSYDILWKYSRALVDAGEFMEDEDKQIEYYGKAVELAETAISIKKDGWEAHLYAAVSYGRKALAVGAKERIKLSKKIRTEAEKTIELNSESDIAYHVLARWNRKISSLSWIEKKFANIFLGGVPKGASLEKAVELFKKAISIKPDYINHYLELGITLKEMKLYPDAKSALAKAVSLIPKSPRDKVYQGRAKELLQKID